jgi:hypothetical protein
MPSTSYGCAQYLLTMEIPNKSECPSDLIIHQLRQNFHFQALYIFPKCLQIWWCLTSYLCELPLHAARPFTLDLKVIFTLNHMWLPDLYVSLKGPHFPSWPA